MALCLIIITQTVDAKVLERMKFETAKLKKIRNKINHSDTDFDEKKPHVSKVN